MKSLTVGELKKFLKDVDDDREILVDIGDPPVRFDNRVKLTQTSWRNTHIIYGVDTEVFAPVVLEL